MARTLTSLLGCKHECKWATQAIEVEEKKKKEKKKKRKKNTKTDTRAHAHTRSEREGEREEEEEERERDPQEYRAAGFLATGSHISLNLSRLSSVWASPEGRAEG